MMQMGFELGRLRLALALFIENGMPAGRESQEAPCRAEITGKAWGNPTLASALAPTCPSYQPFSFRYRGEVLAFPKSDDHPTNGACCVTRPRHQIFRGRMMHNSLLTCRISGCSSRSLPSCLSAKLMAVPSGVRLGVHAIDGTLLTTRAFGDPDPCKNPESFPQSVSTSLARPTVFAVAATYPLSARLMSCWRS